MKSVTINRAKRLRDEPHTGHNRWHPDVPPILEVEPGEEVVLETRDAADGQIGPGMGVDILERRDKKVGHPLTGPVFVRGARPGDLLEVEYLDIVAQPYGWTSFRPGVGFLRDLFPNPFLVHWDIRDGWATSREIPGVRLPDGSFMGTAGVAPSRTQLEAWTRREADLARRGGMVFPPDPQDAVPPVGPVAEEGLRTIPPRENCGNIDAKQLTRGSRLLVPVNVDGALYSVGDGHFAQGDGECCITAIEMGATVAMRFRVHAGEAARKGIRWPRFAHPGYFLPPQWAAPQNFIATVGMPVRDDGTQESEDHLSLAARNALLRMIELLQERGFTREQAYAICSVAVDLRISNVVDLPNVTVAALLPEASRDRRQGVRKYVLRRLASSVPTLIGITVVIFAALRVLPGDPVAMIASEGQGTYALRGEELARARATLGLDKPYHVQYLDWMGDVLRGDLGWSFWRGEPIRDIILRRGPITAQIALMAVALSWIIGIPVGIASAVWRRSAGDHVTRVVVTVFMAVPSFWVGLVIVLVGVLAFTWRPPLTIVYLWDDPWRNLQITLGPAIAMGAGLGAVMARITRSSVLEALEEDYVRTARAKGLGEPPIVWRHVLKNALLPIVTLSGLTLGGLLGGSVAVERAFGVPGLGTALVQALTERDWMMIQNLVLLYGVIFTVINLLVDLSYGLFDPRIRYQ